MKFQFLCEDWLLDLGGSVHFLMFFRPNFGPPLGVVISTMGCNPLTVYKEYSLLRCTKLSRAFFVPQPDRHCLGRNTKQMQQDLIILFSLFSLQVTCFSILVLFSLILIPKWFLAVVGGVRLGDEVKFLIPEQY